MMLMRPQVGELPVLCKYGLLRPGPDLVARVSQPVRAIVPVRGVPQKLLCYNNEPACWWASRKRHTRRVAGDIINQAGGHGGSRQGAGRPLGARDRKTLQGQADIAVLMTRIEPAQLLLLSPVDVLRLAMLLALRRGDLAAATEHARRLLPTWEPRMGLVAVEGKPGGSRGAAVVSRLVEALHPVEVSEKATKLKR